MFGWCSIPLEYYSYWCNVTVQAQKERNVLKHQSTLLLADVVKDEKMMHLVQEVEVLKRTLEEEQQRHITEIQELQV